MDLAVEGIAPDRFFKAWAAAGAHSNVPIELVDMDEVGETMRKLILEYGEFSVTRVQIERLVSEIENERDCPMTKRRSR